MTLRQGSIKPPLDLDNVAKKEAIALGEALFANGEVALLWQCDKCHLDYPPGRVTKRFHKDPKAIPGLLGKIKGKHIEDTGASKEYKKLIKTPNLPEDYEKMTPWAKVKLLANANIGRSQLTRFLTLGAEMNAMQSAKGSLRSVTSGVASYWRFCQLLGRPSFPPTEDTAQLWSATFNPGKTFNQYIAHLQKASTLLKDPIDWLAPAIRCVSKGLENAQDPSFKFPNFIGAATILKLLTWVKGDSVTGQAYFLSFLFSLRVPCGTYGWVSFD